MTISLHYSELLERGPVAEGRTESYFTKMPERNGEVWFGVVTRVSNADSSLRLSATVRNDKVVGVG